MTALNIRQEHSNDDNTGATPAMTQASLFSKAAPTLARARRKGHQGAARAGQRAGAVWLEAACLAVLRLGRHITGGWLLETIREWLADEQFPVPPDARAWGAVLQRLKREGRIQAVGYRSARSSHGSPKVLWRVVP